MKSCRERVAKDSEKETSRRCSFR